MEDLLQLCARTYRHLQDLPAADSIHALVQKDAQLRDYAQRIQRGLRSCAEVYRPSGPVRSCDPGRPLKAVTWNLERGKNFSALLRTLQSHSQLRDADLYFLTEVDWGMARSGNRNIAADLAAAVECHAYFAPSYYNFTKGHGSERHLPGENAYGLHGKAILSRYPLENLRAVSMSNAFNKLKSKEARLGEKRALLGDLRVGDQTLTLACAHLDAFSSPKMRAQQLAQAAHACENSPHALLAGDWNTNTLDSTNGLTVFWSVLKQLLGTGPQEMIRRHYPGPQQRFDRHLFRMLGAAGFEVEACNESGAGTYDLVSNDKELGQMAQDQFPDWIVRWINRQIQKGGGKISLKLDWFAGKGLRYLEKRVVPLKSGQDYYPAEARPSDHHPVLLCFRI